MRTRIISALLTPFALTATLPAQSAQALPSTGKPDLAKQPTLYAVGYAHLDTEWRWEYPQVIDEYLRRTMEDNFRLIDTYPHYIFNFSGANRYRLMKEYYPADFARMKGYIAQGRWFPAGSSMEEGDVNAPSAEAILRQVLYGNKWFQREFGKSSAEYMLPDCFGFPASLPSLLAHAGVMGFSTQKLSWGSSANVGGPESIENTPEGTPFNVGVWVGPDGRSVLAALNPGAYNGNITTDMSQPLPPLPPNPAMAGVEGQIAALQGQMGGSGRSGGTYDPAKVQDYFALRSEQSALAQAQTERTEQRFQGDWAGRVLGNGKATGLFADYHYYGTGDIGGSPREESVKRLEAIITKGTVDMPPANGFNPEGMPHPAWPETPVGAGPVHVVSATADQMFRDITPAQAAALPRYTGEMELINHSAGSLTSQAYQKRWIRKEELLADAAEKSSIAAQWLGARTYPQEQLNDAWTLAMAAHFHDLAAGTATPRSYEFAWNDDVIAMNQFAGILQSATEGVTAALDTQGQGVPVIIFNPLNIDREDVVEAGIDFGRGGMPKAVRVTAPDGTVIPAQLVNGKVLFAAHVPSVGYAVYHVEPATAPSAAAGANISPLRITNNELENAFYRVTLNADGDVVSIFDKGAGRELLAAPARLAISEDNPTQWPAWNMDWGQEQAPPKTFVSGPAKVRVVENGPVRVALEITRETAGSRFVQTVRLASGDAGKRVEFSNAIDWATQGSNLKATFPLTASNEMATYNWDVGTIQRPTAQPKKFEVPSHQWIDLTDGSGQFGATVLTDCKNGSDKPNDHTLRLTLLRTPGVRGGYPDEATQDIGHHDFLYGLTGHTGGWREAGTDWQAERLNAPLIAFQSAPHAGALGRSFSLVKVSNPRVRIMALKKAEDSDEIIVRLVELDGKPQPEVRVSFAAPVTAVREVNAQEGPLTEAAAPNNTTKAPAPAQVAEGSLVTSFGAYQPRTFAVKLGPAPASVTGVRSTPVTLQYELATATEDGSASTAGFDGKGNALPTAMLPEQIPFHGVTFQLPLAKSGVPNAIVAKGQRLELPAGEYNHVYFLAAATGGDQKATFEAGSQKADLQIENWGGFLGQWDDRTWSSKNTAHDNYGEMTGLRPGFIKRADVAWYASHHHDAHGKNIPYSYAYLFGYSMDLPAGAKTLKLPTNPSIRILAVSVAEENPAATPVQPLYDVLPSPTAGAPDFMISAPKAVAVSEGRTATAQVFVMPRGGFDGNVKLSASGLPAGVTASFSPAVTTGASTVTLKASSAASSGRLPAQSTVTITATAGELSHTAGTTLSLMPILKGTLPVDLSSVYNVPAIYNDGAKFTESASADGGGYAFSARALGTEQVGDEVMFKLGPANAPDAVTGKTVTLPVGKFTSLKLLATAVDGNQRRQVFTVTYADGTSSSMTQTLSDWSSAGNSSVTGESSAVNVPYRLAADGSTDANSFSLFAYSLTLDPSKEVRSLTLPANRNVLLFAATLVPVVQ